MKKKLLILIPLLVLSFSSTSFAHPGRTDSSGGHTCRTNCPDWGYTTGEYHYHNGGSESSGGGSGSSGSSSVNTGPSAAELAAQKEAAEKAAAKEAAAEAAKQEAIERNKGADEGYDAGYEAGYAAASKNSSGSGSDAYKKGFTEGYNKGYEQATEKLESEKKIAKKDGYALGQKQDNLKMPDKYAKSDVLGKTFETEFNKAVKERDDIAIAKYTDQGYKDGIKDASNPPKKVKDSYVQAYDKAFEKGLAELKKQYMDQGYKAAFTTLSYQKPSLPNEKYIDWYKEGFDSNEEVAEIQQTAFALGESGEEFSPEEYKHAEVIFEHYYSEGEAERKKDNAQTAGGIGLIGLAWLSRRFYVAKKTIS